MQEDRIRNLKNELNTATRKIIELEKEKSELLSENSKLKSEVVDLRNKFDYLISQKR